MSYGPSPSGIFTKANRQIMRDVAGDQMYLGNADEKALERKKKYEETHYTKDFSDDIIIFPRQKYD